MLKEFNLSEKLRTIRSYVGDANPEVFVRKEDVKEFIKRQLLKEWHDKFIDGKHYIETEELDKFFDNFKKDAGDKLNGKWI